MTIKRAVYSSTNVSLEGVNKKIPKFKSKGGVDNHTFPQLHEIHELKK